jgi:hypothetical protein
VVGADYPTSLLLIQELDMTDWESVRVDYEVLGKSVAEICDSHQLSACILESAIEDRGWSAPSTSESTTEPSGSMEKIEALQEEARKLHSQHSLTAVKNYISVETSFISRLKDLMSQFNEAGEAKALAETLNLIKPSIIRQADSAAEGGIGGNLIIMNKFAVPEPGDPGYIAPNAVLVGEQAKAATDQVLSADYTTLEIPMPEDMN